MDAATAANIIYSVFVQFLLLCGAGGVLVALVTLYLKHRDG